MIVDASVMLAVLLGEPDRERYYRFMALSPQPRLISPINYLEIITRLLRSGDNELLRGADDLVAALEITIATVTPEQARIARQAYLDYGKGRHPAKLNIGDCFAYALSKARREPLLFKGDDFSQTDVEAAL